MHHLNDTSIWRIITMAQRGSILISALLLCGCVLPVPVFTAQARAQISDSPDDPPIFTDWWYQMHVPLKDSSGEYLWPQNPTPEQLLGVPEFTPSTEYFYSPMPQPGGMHGIGFSGWMSWLLDAAMERVAQSGTPVTILMRERNSPYPYHTQGLSVDPNALPAALNALSKLDYLIMDLEYEPDNIERNIREIVRQVRSHPNPEIANAYIGNYSDYPGALDRGYIWDNQQDRGGGGSYGGESGWDRDEMYRTMGLNIAMPSAYPYEAYSVHARPGLQGNDQTSPNVRSASLWAPLEHISVAARELESDHKLIPWVSNYVPYPFPDPNGYYNAPPPPQADLRALIQHLYLRGADGFVVWTRDDQHTEHPTVDYPEYRQLTLTAWEEVETLLEGESRIEVLNLGTSKARGIEWSAVRSQSHVVVLVSNLSGNINPRAILLPQIDGIPRQTEPVSNGTHRIFVYDLPQAEEPASVSDDDSSSTDPTNQESSYSIATTSVQSGGGGGGGGGGSGGSGGGSGGGGGGTAPSGGSVSSTTSGESNIVRITRSSGSSSSQIDKTEGDPVFLEGDPVLVSEVSTD